MKLSATIAVNPAAVIARQSAAWLLTVTNPSGAPVRVANVRPFVTGGGSAAESVAASIGSGTPTPREVPAGGSVTLSGSVTPHAPQRPGSAAVTYAVGAVVTLPDGSEIHPTKATLTVNAPTP